MGPTTERLLHAALALPEDERLELAEALFASQDEQDELPFDPAWLDEARRRSLEIETGAVKPSPWSVVRDRVQRRLEGPSGD